MTRVWRALAAATVAAVCGWGTAAQAAVLTLVPQHQTVDQGDIAAVDVVVTGLLDQRVAAYDFWLHFDPLIVQLLSVDAGPALGGPFDSFSFADPVAGAVNVGELSFLRDLSGLQSGNGSLLLFTVRFEATGLGTSALSFSENILGVDGGFLGDEDGLRIEVTDTEAGSITVVGAPPPPPPPPPPIGVPEPGMPGLLLAAAAAAALSRRR